MPPASAAAVAAPAAAAGGDDPAAAPAAAQTNPIFGLLRMLAIWWLFRAFFSGGGSKAGGGAATSTSQLARSDYYLPLMQRSTPVDVAMVLSEESFLAPGWLAFGGEEAGGGPAREREGDAARVAWRASAVPLAATGSAESKVTVSYTPSESVKNNGTLFLHVVVGLTGHPLDAALEGYDPSKVFNKTFAAVAFHPRPRKKGGVNLLGGSTTGEEVEVGKDERREKGAEEEALAAEEAPPVGGGWGGSIGTKRAQKGGGGKDSSKQQQQPPREIISYLKPNLTVAMVDDFQAYARGKIPEQMVKILDLDEESHTYNPSLWLNDFWLMRSHLVQMNETVAGPIQLHLSLYSLPSWKLLLFTSMEHSFQMQQSWGAMNDGEPDELKRVLTEGNPYFLALTMCVSMLHSVFDALAFKNDIGFWKGKQDVAGLSVRTIGFNAICQAIIFLYLLDNDTSFVVLASTAVGVAIEFWKLTQAMHVTLERRPAGSSSLLPLRLKFKDKQSYTDSRTDEHDAAAMKYLGLGLLPCVGGYALYALKYQTHRSWYSWVLSSLVGAVYAFGFALMCPQLYLNYKLKSVAHLPWRQMTYKFLNTIIDDLFAFVIKMPTLHRLAVFRDDVVFAVYLYQRWIYRVDATRANEFGFVAAKEGEEGEGADGAAAAGTTAAVAGAAGAPAAAGAAAPAGATATAAAAAPSAAGVRKRRGEKEEEEETSEAEGAAAAAAAAAAAGGGKKDE